MKAGLSQRAVRVGDQIQREIAQLLTTSVKDPRLAGVTVTGVEMTPDLSIATVRYVCHGGLANEAETLRGFASVGGFLRRAIAERLDIFKAPTLRFAYDRAFEEGARLSALIETARAEDQRILGRSSDVDLAS